MNVFFQMYVLASPFWSHVHYYGQCMRHIYLFPCVFSTKNSEFSSLTAQGASCFLLKILYIAIRLFLVHFLYQILLFRFLGFRLFFGFPRFFDEDTGL